MAQPEFCMPVVNRSMPFSTTVTATNDGRYPIAITVADSASRQLFSMAGGVVSFVPAGKDPFLLYATYDGLPPMEPGTGYLLQRVWPTNINWLRPRLPAGVPPMVEIVYFDVDPAAVRADFTPRVAKVPPSVLKHFGTPAGTPTLDDYKNQLLDKLMDGEALIYVPEGTPVGKMSGDTFTLFFTGGDTVGLSPIPFIRAIPEFSESWAGHPLIGAVSSLIVPVDVYAGFRTWDNAAKASRPLPDATDVQLMDHHTFGSDVSLATVAVLGGEGEAEFHLSQTTSSPDLFFQVALGAANPEPGLVTEPWRSTDHHTVATSPGYYGNFEGTRLGSAIEPIQFQIGVGFWSDLISFRPPPAVQLSLKSANRAVQAIENAYTADILLPQTGEIIHEVSPLSLDFYGVRVDTLPDGYATPEDLLTFIRTHFNDFIDTTNSFFMPLDANWSKAGISPVGIILRIDFYKYYVSQPDSGAIVVGEAGSDSWTISTIYDPALTPFYDFDADLHHPLGGIRRWGFFVNADGSYTFYTKGADRPWAAIDYKVDWMIFGGADNLWLSYQAAISKMVNSQGGIATILPATVDRFEWEMVKPLYWNPDPNNPWLVNAKP